MIVNSVAWLGKQGTKAVATSLILGMVVSPIIPSLRALVPPAIFVLLVLAFVRVDLGAVYSHVRRPWRLAAATGWTMLACPLIIGLGVSVSGLVEASPDLALALMILAVAPPVMSAPAFAYLMGLDGALSLTLLVATMLATPLSAPLISALILKDALPLEALALALRLCGLLAGSMAAAWIIRRLAGPARIDASKAIIDGVNVILLFIFALAVMDGVLARAISAPGLVAALLLLAFAVAVTLLGLTSLLFRPAGNTQALTLGLSAGCRNMGLMLAALAGHVPDLVWIFIGLAQFPIYFLPWMLRPLIARTAAT